MPPTTAKSGKAVGLVGAIVAEQVDRQIGVIGTDHGSEGAYARHGVIGYAYAHAPRYGNRLVGVGIFA